MNVTGLTKKQIHEKVLEAYELWKLIEKEMLEKSIVKEYTENKEFKKEVDEKLGLNKDSEKYNSS